MITLEKCKKELNHDERKYTDTQVREIKNMLYEFAEIELNNSKLIQNEKKCNTIRESFDRRTRRKKFKPTISN